MNNTSQTTPHKRGRGIAKSMGIASHCQKSEVNNTPNRTISYLSDWRDDVEILAAEGNAGRSERMLADGILRLSGGRPVFASIPEICAASGLGKAAVRAALARLQARSLIRYQSDRGRGQKTVIELVLRGSPHGL